MGVSASSCMGRRRKRGEYSMGGPLEARRHGVLPTLAHHSHGTGRGRARDIPVPVMYRNFDEVRDRPGEEERDVAGDSEANHGGGGATAGVQATGGVGGAAAAVEGRSEEGEGTARHIHRPLPAGTGGLEEPHPDLPAGVTCITCAATMMERGQEAGESEKKTIQKFAEKESTRDGEGSETNGEQAPRPAVQCNGSVPCTEGPDGQNTPTDQEKETQGQPNRKRGNKMSRGSRWRRRYNALDNVRPLVKSGVRVDLKVKADHNADHTRV